MNDMAPEANTAPLDETGAPVEPITAADVPDDGDAVLEIEADDDDGAAAAVVPPALPDSPPQAEAPAPETVQAPQGDAVVGPIPEDERDIPTSVDPALAPGVVLSDHIYVEAAVNLPGWGLWAVPADEVKDAEGNVIEPAHTNRGWIPNNEEGVHAVELGFAKIVEPARDEEPPTGDE